MNSQKNRIENVIYSNDESHTPVLLNFQNGLLKKNCLDSTNYFEAVNDNTKEKLSILTTSDGNVYNGKINDNSLNNNLTNTFIAIKNKQTNKVRLIQIEEASLINSIYNESKISREEDNSVKDGNTNANLSKVQMIRNFGGTKAVRNLERSQRMKVNVDIVKEQLNKTIELTEINNSNDFKEKQITINQEINLIRPPLNENAKNIDDVYSLTNIIPTDLSDRLNEECYAILDSQIESVPINSEFLLDHIKNIKKSDNPRSLKNLQNLKICLYMDGLMNLIKQHQRSMSKIELSKVTEKVETHIRQNFSDPNLKQRTKTKFSTDKAICYYIVLSLLLNNYEIGMNILSQNLSIPINKLTKYALIVNSKAQPGSDIYKLQLPGKVQTKMIVKNRKMK